MLLMAGDVSIIALSYVLSLLIWFGSYDHHNIVTLLTGFIFLIASIFIFYLLDFYNIDLISQRLNFLIRHSAGVVVTAGLLALSFFFWPDLKSGRGVFLLCLTMIGTGTYFWRLAFLKLFKRSLIKQKKLLIIGADEAGAALHHLLKDSPDYRLLGHITNDGSSLWQASGITNAPGTPVTLRQMCRELEANILVLAASHFQDPSLLKSALDCKLDGVMVCDMPTFYETTAGKIPVEHVTDSWFVFAQLLGLKRSMYNLRLKRSADIMLAFVGLILTSPLALVAAVAIKLDSAGTVLYRQRRVGLNGDVFTLLKFRSMQNGTDLDRAHAGEKVDPRVTRVGAIMRLFRIDELPQMWNVLRGEMSFIGPRALMEEEVSEFESQIPYFSLRHSIRPGITGWAQINYRHGTKVKDGREKLEYDLFYIKNLSPFLDFRILVTTIKVVLSRRGAR